MTLPRSDPGYKRSGDLSAFSYSVAKNAMNQEGHEAVFGQYILSLRLIARWNNANPSTLLHETGHLFLDARMRVATDLLAQGNLTKEQQAFMKSVQDVLDWFGIKDLAAWNGLSPCPNGRL